MKLKNNLYSISRTSREPRQADIELRRDCVIYKAHFPEEPITPGVCIIQIATELLEEIESTAFTLEEVVNAKFLSPINPDKVLNVSCSYPKYAVLPDGKVKVSVAVTGDSTAYAKLSLIYALK